MQSIQEEFPILSLYLPASHVTHGSPSGPVVPVSHLQSDFIVLELFEDDFSGHSSHSDSRFAPRTDEYLPAGHETHVVFPIKILYFPGIHSSQDPPLGPVVPLTQKHSVSSLLAINELEF